MLLDVSAGLMVTPPLVIGLSLALGMHVSDMSRSGLGESAMTSAGPSDASNFDSSLLDTGSGMDTKLRVLTWSLHVSGPRQSHYI